ncbi:metal ABC transporter ATP-binding protein [Pelodictyon phaeoclathratiforme]|jgi:zinc transport system ATP-binding protein|uniref:ABC transporter related n=1 Tax=Pelodictyon phaeoclathratiforme (strain DSM 5477 / BU-1) TaxID=324925 RepID=B4SBC2_PELPB|nr:ABC transporter ATP-binding protein [Pelodictyon phaeoclathratiforme]ACF42543.1 ABC transporter related [Pelodictyon phaeoclathratiforme BU-1]MBV5290241.1 ABC transporter ATP-binding protein [Pelodictyon phaeoclathratiforme]
MTTPVIECNRLSVELGGVMVLDGVTLSVCKGDYLGLVGPNGGGKTTLLRVILGLEKSSGGSVSVFGALPGSFPERIGYVPQRLFFDREFPISVRELVLMGRLSKKKLFQHFNRIDREKADAALGVAGLERLADRRIGTLSGGELQRTLIARALAGEPELLLLDEPTASVDPQMKTTIYDLLDNQKKKLTIVLVSHDIGGIKDHVSGIATLNTTLYAPRDICL